MGCRSFISQNWTQRQGWTYATQDLLHKAIPQRLVDGDDFTIWEMHPEIAVGDAIMAGTYHKDDPTPWLP